MEKHHNLSSRTGVEIAQIILQILFRAAVSTLLVNVACAGVEDHVVGIWHAGIRWLPPGVSVQYGSGICIDPTCSVIATTYHAQLLAHSRNLKVTGGHVRKTRSYAQDSDGNKTEIPVGREHFLYNVAKDITFLYTTKPIHHKTGVQYALNCNAGQKVTIAGDHLSPGEQTQARIIGVNVPLRMGNAEINDNLILDVVLKPGDSGSAVFDSNGRLLGMIVAVGRIETKRGPLRVSLALPVSALAMALRSVDPQLASKVFGDMPPDRPSRLRATWSDIGPSDFEAAISSDRNVDVLAEVTVPVVESLPVVHSSIPDPVRKLQAKADAASKLMVNLLATECVASAQTRWCYEVSITDGDEQYRAINRNGKLGPPIKDFLKEMRSKLPLSPESSWADSLGLVTDSTWTFQGSVKNRYLFTGNGRTEDDRCWFRESPISVPIFQPQHPEWEGSVACSELLLTNSEFDVLTMYTEYYPPHDCLIEKMDTVIEYQWVRLPGIAEPIILPAKENLSAKVRGRTDPLLATVEWSDYRKFRTDHKITF